MVQKCFSSLNLALKLQYNKIRHSDVSNCNNNFPRTRAGNTLYVTGLHKHLFFRWFNAAFNKSSQAAMNLCVFQAAAVRKPHKVYV